MDLIRSTLEIVLGLKIQRQFKCIFGELLLYENMIATYIIINEKTDVYPEEAHCIGNELSTF